MDPSLTVFFPVYLPGVGLTCSDLEAVGDSWLAGCGLVGPGKVVNVFHPNETSETQCSCTEQFVKSINIPSYVVFDPVSYLMYYI